MERFGREEGRKEKMRRMGEKIGREGQEGREGREG
jgi:hypothetical protein